MIDTIFWWTGLVVIAIGGLTATLMTITWLLEHGLRTAKAYPYFLMWLWSWLRRKTLREAISTAVEELARDKIILFKAEDYEENELARRNAVTVITAFASGVRKAT